MSTIFLDEHCTVKSYSASSKNGKSMVRIEIEVRDHYSLGCLLRELDRTREEQQADKASARKPKAKSAQLALPPPPLRLNHFGDADW
ncbi:hypothetical protein IFT84_10215 [Rhizobium sp. CFBP 8762]|uniref:hypothetical protein n=1 Tax=Rhizobium sp. CFBP 8762 TaxID=2775279 RepID=UPI0017864069|nr:hypothetical protein [Rhizobium sp. CFBP 8762]MBD8554897.1 hypothetical protein [Rhizobium sp. CFBP 8762]